MDVVTTFRLKDLTNYGCDILLRFYNDNFYHLYCDNCVTAQDVSNMSLPRFFNGYDPDYESSLSSLISSVADSSPFSGREDDDDDDDDDDDESHEIEHDGPHVNGAAAIEPSQELQSPEEQLHSLQSGSYEDKEILSSLLLHQSFQRAFFLIDVFNGVFD